LPTGEYREADHYVRTKGEKYGAARDTEAVCIVVAHDLRREVLELHHADANQREREVLMRERACGKFKDWLPGFTPKEHVQMVLSERAIQIAEERKQADECRAEERRRTDEQRAEERRVADLRREDDRRQQDRQQEAANRRSDIRWRIWLAILAAVFGFLGSRLDKIISGPPTVMMVPDAKK